MITGVALNATIQPYGSHYIYCVLDESFGDSYEVVYCYVFNRSSGRVQDNGRIVRVMLHQCSLHLGTCSRCMVGMIIARLVES